MYECTHEGCDTRICVNLHLHSAAHAPPPTPEDEVQAWLRVMFPPGCAARRYALLPCLADEAGPAADRTAPDAGNPTDPYATPVTTTPGDLVPTAPGGDGARVPGTA